MRQLIPRLTSSLSAKPVKGDQDSDSVSGSAFGSFSGSLTSDFAIRRLHEFNRLMRRYGEPDWTQLVIPENHGPALGEAQGCTSCHDGKTRGILTFSTSISQIERKTFNGLSMPPQSGEPRLLEREEMRNPVLDESEKRNLMCIRKHHHELLDEFLKSRPLELKKWLLETTCE